MIKNQFGKTASAAAMLEYIVGCKWSIRILTLIHQGIDRPGAITRSVDGLTTKVQNDCLNNNDQLWDFCITDMFRMPN